MQIKNRKLVFGSLFIVIVILIIAVTGYNSRNKQKEEVAQVKNIAVDFTEKKSNFFVEQLTEQENEIYSDIAEKLDVYQGGEILLKENISPKSMARISDAIRFFGGGYSTARGLACFYQVVMGMKFSCSADWFALNPSGVTTGGGMCTHR